VTTGYVLWVNTPLRDQRTQAEFRALKAHLGIATNADVVRFLIREKAREIQDEHVHAAAGEGR